MQYIDITLPMDTIEVLFPCTGEEGTCVQHSLRAVAIVYGILGTQTGIQWRLPDVFGVRYGSSYVATATVGDTSVRFHMDEGDFKEGDDK